MQNMLLTPSLKIFLGMFILTNVLYTQEVGKLYFLQAVKT